MILRIHKMPKTIIMIAALYFLQKWWTTYR